jgi:hypothetical protein
MFSYFCVLAHRAPQELPTLLGGLSCAGTKRLVLGVRDNSMLVGIFLYVVLLDWKFKYKRRPYAVGTISRAARAV